MTTGLASSALPTHSWIWPMAASPPLSRSPRRSRHSKGWPERRRRRWSSRFQSRRPRCSEWPATAASRAYSSTRTPPLSTWADRSESSRARCGALSRFATATASGRVANARLRGATVTTSSTGSAVARRTSRTWSCSGACCLTRTGWRQYRRPQFSLTSQQEVAPLMGSKAVEPKLYLSFSLDAAVPANHIVRRLAAAVDFGFVRNLTKQHYSHTGQPSVDPVVLFKLWLLGYLFNIRSERRLCEEAGLNLAWRWFLGYELDEALPDHSVLTKARRRFGTRVYELFFKQIVQLCEQRGLVQGDVLFIDSTLSDANAARDTLRSRALAGPRLPEPNQFVKDLFALNEPAPLPEPPRAKGGTGPKPGPLA